MNKDILDIINQAILTEAPAAPAAPPAGTAPAPAPAPAAETKPEAALDDSKTAQETAPGENTTYTLRYLTYLERITKFSEDTIIRSANKLSVALVKVLKPLSIKPGPNKYNFNPPTDDEGTFYEMLRWEVKDDLKYRMYTVDKMKGDNLEGQATEKVLGGLLGGVKLPTVDYAAQIKYNPEYLQHYNRLLGFLTKAIVENNKSVALHNRETGEKTKDAAKEVDDKLKAAEAEVTPEPEAKPQQAQLAYAGVPEKKQLPYAGVTQPAIEDKSKVTPALASDKTGQKSIAMAGTAATIGYSPETKTLGATTSVPSTSASKKVPGTAINASADFGTIINDILFEKEVSAAGSVTSKVAGKVSHGISNVANATRLPGMLTGMITGLANVPGQIMTMFVPGIYNVIGYDFGYIGGKRMTAPKVFKKMTIKNVSSLLQFIENSHVYEDMSGKMKGPSAGIKGDMHQIKPVKLIMYRLPKEDMFKDATDDQLLDPDKPMSPEDLEKLDKNKIVDVLQLMPAGTLAIAFWGRIIRLDEINNSEAGKKTTPTNILLTTKTRPEWYFFIPAVKKKIDSKPVEAAKEEAKKPQPEPTKALALVQPKALTLKPGEEAAPTETGVNALITKGAKGELITAEELSSIKDIISKDPEQAKEIKSKAAKSIPNLTDEFMIALGDNKTPAEVKSAYRTASVKYHPDKATDKSPEGLKAAGEKQAKLNTDYALLKKMGLAESKAAFKLLMKHLLG